MFVEVLSQRNIKTVARLAREIWSDHYIPIIGADQVEYMLTQFQSVEAISDQIENQSYWYFLIQDENVAVGYLGLQGQPDVLFMSKLYVVKSVRGRGFGGQAVNFVLQFANDKVFSTIRLTVNKQNAVAIAAYEHTGFVRTAEIVTDIGNGYVMDDYVFEMKC